MTSTGAKLLRNSFWYGLETIIETVVFLSASVAVARYLGPEKLGYFSYVNFFVSVVTRTGGAGLSGATRKFMSEYLGQGDPGRARAVYHLAYRYQAVGVVVLAALGLLAVVALGDPGYRLFAAVLVVSMVPGLLSWIPAQANNAFEDAAKNTSSAFGYLLTYAAVIVLTLHFHWDLLGIASATLLGRLVEAVLRTVSLNRRLHVLPLTPLSREVRGGIRRFCLEAIGVQVLMAVVWDRTEMIFLKHYSTLEQISFYSISYGLVNNLLVLPRIVTGATGMTLMVDAARSPASVAPLVRNTCRFLLLIVTPVYLGAAAIAPQAIRVVYGSRYAHAGLVLLVAAALSIPRAFQELPDVLLRVADRQRQLFGAIAAVGVFNVLLDWLLIPRFHAVGAAWGNGISQAVGLVLIWEAARRSFRFGFPVASAARLGVAGALMAAAAYAISSAMPGLAGVLLAVLAAAPLYVLLVRLFGGLEHEDRRRLELIGQRLPRAIQRGYVSVITFATPLPADATY